VDAEAEALARERGERIRTLRKALGLKIPGLAKTIGCTKQLLSKWEKGEIENYGADAFVRLALELKTTPHHLLWGGKQPSPPPASSNPH